MLTKKQCTKIFIVALCILASNWKQSKYHRKADKQTIVYWHSGIQLGSEKERTNDINNHMDASQNIMMSGRIQTQDGLVYSIHTTFKNKQK